jgi:hypothetical protein
MARPHFVSLLLALSLTSCDDAVTAPAVDASSDRGVDVPSVDSPSTDGSADDVARFDGAVTDAAVDVVTDAARDATRAFDALSDADDGGTWNGSDEILGTLRGTCGTIRAMLHSPAPSLLRNDLAFVAGERYARDTLTPGGQRLYDTMNAGGSSTESEAMSYEVLHFCEGASLVATETEIRYQPPDDTGANSITDLLVTIGGERVGVSVTRAYVPVPMMLTETSVRDLLTRKLVGINRSSMRVLPSDRWVKQILHVFAANATSADLVARVWATLDATTRADTIVVVTATVGGGFIYCNPDPALGSECPPIGGG